jgi:hypothetical protein
MKQDRRQGEEVARADILPWIMLKAGPEDLVWLYGHIAPLHRDYIEQILQLGAYAPAKPPLSSEAEAAAVSPDAKKLIVEAAMPTIQKQVKDKMEKQEKQKLLLKQEQDKKAAEESAADKPADGDKPVEGSPEAKLKAARKEYEDRNGSKSPTRIARASVVASLKLDDYQK